MATGDSWDSRLIDGLAQHIEDAGLGVWRPDGTVYTANEVAIVDRAVPDSPDRLIVLTTYGGADAPDGLQDTDQPVQIRMRGTSDPRVVADLASDLYDLLHASGRQTWGTGDAAIEVVDVQRVSYTSLGQDQQYRWEISHNYLVKAMRPTTNRQE